MSAAKVHKRQVDDVDDVIRLVGFYRRNHDGLRVRAVQLDGGFIGWSLDPLQGADRLAGMCSEADFFSDHEQWSVVVVH